MSEPTSPGSRGPVSVVLVHGAWHGAWCWARVEAGLVARGIRTLAIDLPGHGGDPGQFGDLHADAAAVRSLLDSLEPPVVLVGHSYGGAVITEAGGHGAVGHLVYLCAFALDENESCIAAAADDPALGAISHDGRPDPSVGLVLDEEGNATVSPELARAMFYNDCDSETADWAVARLGPQPMANLAQSPSSAAWRTKPSTYVVCAADMAVHPALQRALAARCHSSTQWGTGHSPFLSAPELVVELLAGLATSAAPGARADGGGRPEGGPGPRVI